MLIFQYFAQISIVMAYYVITEHSAVCNANTHIGHERSVYIVPTPTFEQLKAILSMPGSQTIMGFRIYKGQEEIYFKNYVGILTLPNGSVFEILPKIMGASQTDISRDALLKMLRYTTYLPFKNITPASLKNTRLPLWEIFIIAFLEEINRIAKISLQKDYQQIENEQPYLKGKWLLHKQNSLRQELFYVFYDEFSANILPNQLLKTCLEFLEKRSKSVYSQAQIRRWLCQWEMIDSLADFRQKFKNPVLQQRRLAHYKVALSWAEVLLQGNSWLGAGQQQQLSLLFPMERIFEQYIAQGFKRHLPDYELIYQDNSNYLIDEHQGKQHFSLRPDLVLRKADKTFILDMKWKWIEPHLPNYGIEQADLYQLYAYGQKYAAETLYLIYPAHKYFKGPLLPFHYNNELKLLILPFDITQNLIDEMKKMEGLLAKEL